jgi:hypothetical protein
MTPAFIGRAVLVDDGAAVDRGQARQRLGVRAGHFQQRPARNVRRPGTPPAVSLTLQPPLQRLDQPLYASGIRWIISELGREFVFLPPQCKSAAQLARRTNDPCSWQREADTEAASVRIPRQSPQQRRAGRVR